MTHIGTMLMRRGAIIGAAGLAGLAAAMWIGSHQVLRLAPSVETPEPADASAADAPRWEPIEDATFDRWFPGYRLGRTVLSCQERGANPEAGIVPPPSHRLDILGAAWDPYPGQSPKCSVGEPRIIRDARSIERLFRDHNIRATNDDELRDLAYLAFFLLRQQHAEMMVAPDPALGDDEIGTDPHLPVWRRSNEVRPPAPLPDSDIFDKQSYEIEENLDGSSAIRGQRLTFGWRVFEIAVHFTRAGRLDRIDVTDTGEIIDPGTYVERELLLVEG